MRVATTAKPVAPGEQLVRHDVLLTLLPVPSERIRSIVDDIFWPLATAASHPRPAAQS